MIASSLFTPYAGLAWRDQHAISFQFHPGMSPAFANALIEQRHDRIPDPDAAIASLDAPNDNARVGEWIRRFLARRAIIGGANASGRSQPMKTRAAVAFAPKQPLEIVELDLEGPKAGEVLVEIMATGICHTDAYTLDGLDSEGIFPSILGHEGAGVVREVGAGVTSVKPGDHVIPLYIAECRPCPSCLSRKTNLCTAIRATQGKGVMPDGTSRFSYKGETIHHYMGCSTFSNFTVLPEIAVAKIREDAPFQTSLLYRLRRHHRRRRGDQHRQGASRAPASSSSASAASASTSSRARGMAGAGRSSASTSIRPSEEWGRTVRNDRFRQSATTSAATIVAGLVALTDGGADYTFDCTGNTDVMRTALESAPSRLGRRASSSASPKAARRSRPAPSS